MGSMELGLHVGYQFIMEPKRSLGFCMPATDAQGLLPRGSRGQMNHPKQASLGATGTLLSILDIME